jgi:hypothetical protein
MRRKVKMLSSSTGWGKPAKQFAELEEAVNDWLANNPDISVEDTHLLSQPTFGWGQLAVAVWYREHSDGSDSTGGPS